MNAGIHHVHELDGVMFQKYQFSQADSCIQCSLNRCPSQIFYGTSLAHSKWYVNRKGQNARNLQQHETTYTTVYQELV